MKATGRVILLPKGYYEMIKGAVLHFVGFGKYGGIWE